MPLNFPNSPTDGQIFNDSATGNRYLWDGAKQIWKWSPNTVSLVVSSTAPGSPVDGQLWWNKELGRFFIYYVDADSSQWIDAVPYNGQITLSFDAANQAGVVANTVYNRANNSTYTGYLNSTLYGAISNAPSGDLMGTDTFVGQSASTDAFGIALLDVFDLIDPKGSLQTIDLG